MQYQFIYAFIHKYWLDKDVYTELLAKDKWRGGGIRLVHTSSYSFWNMSLEFPVFIWAAYLFCLFLRKKKCVWGKINKDFNQSVNQPIIQSTTLFKTT